MLPRSLHSTFLACLLLASALSIEGAKRRSRLDLPISKPADAPLEDNIATASGSDPTYERAESVAVVATNAAPTASSTETETSNSSGSGSSENSSQMVDEYTDEDCDPDFVAFELVTG